MSWTSLYRLNYVYMLCIYHVIIHWMITRDGSDFLFCFYLNHINPFKPACIYTSNHFQDAYVKKLINQNRTDLFTTFFAWDFQIALKSATQNSRLKFEIEEKFESIKFGRIIFFIFCIRHSNNISRRNTKFQVNCESVKWEWKRER